MIKQVLNKIVDKIDFNEKSISVCYINVYNYRILRLNPHIVNQIDYFTLDGILLVLILRIFSKKKINRLSPDFSSYFKDLFCYLDLNKKRVFFVGATHEEMRNFVKKIESIFPNIQIVGYLDGYTLNPQSAFEDIMAKKSDVLIVGMGTPNQEEFMMKIKSFGYEGASFACGAFFSQTAAKGLQYYPKAVSFLHLRWVYRIYREPKLVWRYLIDYPIGLFYILKDLI